MENARPRKAAAFRGNGAQKMRACVAQAAQIRENGSGGLEHPIKMC